MPVTALIVRHSRESGNPGIQDVSIVPGPPLSAGVTVIREGYPRHSETETEPS
jgi:hypothetical protein